MGVVTGQFVYPTGSPVTNGFYQWHLSQDARIVSTACVAPILIVGPLDSSGSMTATIAFNDVLYTALGTNTTYQLTIKKNTGEQLWNGRYFLTGTAANVNLIAPM